MHPYWRLALAAVALLMAAAASPSALDLDVTDADIERVLAVARGREAELARFHAPYITTLNHPAVERIEVISELRRVALLAEARILKGDRGFAYSVTQTRRALGTWKHRLSVVAQVRFHPQNTYVGVPAVDVALAGVTAIGTIRDPVWSLIAAPGETASLMGARIEASFDALTIGQREREVVVRLDGKELMRTSFDFGAID
jgi:hypothetical protein